MTPTVEALERPGAPTVLRIVEAGGEKWAPHGWRSRPIRSVAELHALDTTGASFRIDTVHGVAASLRPVWLARATAILRGATA